MKFLNIFVTLGALLPVTLADGASITTAMQEIVANTISLNTTVATYNGQILALVNILADSTHLLKSIKDGTKVAKKSDELTWDESVAVAGQTQSLAGAVVSSLDTIVSKKKVFQKRLLQPAILLTLKQQEEASDDFSAAVVANVPDILKEVAESLVAPIKEAFTKAIAEYKKFP